MTSDGEAVLLKQTEGHVGLLSRLAACFTDHRDPDLVEHLVAELVRQRVFGLLLGYGDLSDRDELSRDPVLATVVGKTDPTGQGRQRERDKGRPLAGKSTLNRLDQELRPPNAPSSVDRPTKSPRH